MHIEMMALAACLALAPVPAAWAGPEQCPADCLAADREGRTGNYEQALKLYDKCLRNRKLTPRQRSTAYNNRGNAHYFAGNYAKALADYNKALNKDPHNALAYFNRGMVHAAQGQLEAAIREYDQALRLDPRLARAYYDRGMARLFLKAAWSPQAERDFVLAVCLDSRYVGRMYRDGTRLQREGFPEKLVDKFGERVLRIAGQTHQYLIEADQARHEKKYEEALALVDRCLAINPFDGRAYYQRGATRHLMGQDDQALADLERAVANQPRLDVAYLLRARIWLRRGSYDQALAQVNRALALTPDQAPALYLRSRVYEKTGQKDKAVADMRRVVALDPQRPENQQRLQKLLGQ